MTGPEQRALEALKDAARVVETMTSGPCHDSPEPKGETVILAKAKLVIAAKAFARIEREAAKARSKDYQDGERDALRKVLEVIERQRDRGVTSIPLDLLATGVGLVMPKEGDTA